MTMQVGLYQLILSLRKGRHCETQVIVPAWPAATRWEFDVLPPSGYFGMIMWRWSFGNILPGVFRIWGEHEDPLGGGMTYHTGLVTTDMIRDGISTWIWTTQKKPFYLALENTDPVLAHYWENYIWQLNVASENTFHEIEDIIGNLYLPELGAMVEVMRKLAGEQPLRPAVVVRR